jgi:hypothetical protein
VSEPGSGAGGAAAGLPVLLGECLLGKSLVMGGNELGQQGIEVSEPEAEHTQESRRATTGVLVSDHDAEFTPTRQEALSHHNSNHVLLSTTPKYTNSYCILA